MARKARRRKRDEREPLVNMFAAQHGDFRHQFMPDLDSENRRTRMVALIINRRTSTVDRWLFEGGPGFDEPQAMAINHCRQLWQKLGAARVVANYNGLSAGEGDREGYMAALSQIAGYAGEFPRYIWEAFENVVRHDLPAGTAGSNMANNTPQAIAHAKACVGFVASKVAEWRGY